MMKDGRSGRLALVAHCLLNQNSRASGLAESSSVINEVLEFLIRYEIGIIQMPCPELVYAGAMRQPQTKDYYDNMPYKKHCRKIAEELANQIQKYAISGIKLKIVIGVDGSPSCSVNETLGIFMEKLRSAFIKRRISAPFYGVRYRRLKEDIAQLEKLIKLEC
jgi:predicted secreted protein